MCYILEMLREERIDDFKSFHFSPSCSGLFDPPLTLLFLLINFSNKALALSIKHSAFGEGQNPRMASPCAQNNTCTLYCGLQQPTLLGPVFLSELTFSLLSQTHLQPNMSSFCSSSTASSFPPESICPWASSACYSQDYFILPFTSKHTFFFLRKVSLTPIYSVFMPLFCILLPHEPYHIWHLSY